MACCCFQLRDCLNALDNFKASRELLLQVGRAPNAVLFEDFEEIKASRNS